MSVEDTRDHEAEARKGAEELTRNATNLPGGHPEVPEHLKELSSALQTAWDVMIERGAKYGPGNIAEFGEFGVLVRLSDKLARLKHSTGVDFSDESNEDSWIDVIGYGLIGLMWSRGQWPGSEKK